MDSRYYSGRTDETGRVTQREGSSERQNPGFWIFPDRQWYPSTPGHRGGCGKMCHILLTMGHLVKKAVVFRVCTCLERPESQIHSIWLSSLHWLLGHYNRWVFPKKTLEEWTIYKRCILEEWDSRGQVRGEWHCEPSQSKLQASSQIRESGQGGTGFAGPVDLASGDWSESRGHS